MKKSLLGLKKKYFDADLPTEVKIYNGMHMIAVVALLMSTILIRIFFPTMRAFLIAVATAAAALYTLYVGNINGKYELHRLTTTALLAEKKKKTKKTNTKALVVGGMDYDFIAPMDKGETLSDNKYAYNY